MNTASVSIDVERFIDERKTSGRQYLIFAICALVAMTDGFDAQAIGYVAPSIIHDWGVARGALTPVFVAGLAGLMLGAMIFGTLADRIGRRPVLVVCCVLFSVLTFATAFAHSMTTLTMLRFAAGLGLGGAMPNVAALTAEYAPKRVRATVMMIMYSGFSLGAALGGFLSAGLIRTFSWESVFIFGGIFPALATLAVLFWLPESIRFMAARGDQGARIARLLNRIDRAAVIAPNAVFFLPERRAVKSPVAQLFERGRAWSTGLLWAVYFLCFLDLYLLSNWLPILIHDAGARVDQAVFITALYQVGGTLGPIALGVVMDRVRPAAVLTMILFAGAAVVLMIGVYGASYLPLLAVLVCAAGVCVIGGAISATSVAADAYPTALRSTGIGWAFGAGRLGGIVGSAYGGLLFMLHLDIRQILFAGAIPLAIAGLAAFAFSRLGNAHGRFFQRQVRDAGVEGH